MNTPPEYEPWKMGSLRRVDGAVTDYTQPYWGKDGKSTIEEQVFNVGEFKGLDGQTKAEALLEHARGKILLEIGCAPGVVLLTAKQLGFDARGIEPCEEHIEFIREFSGCPVHQGLFENLHLQIKYDTIIAADVLEHVSDPERFVDKALSLLAPGGRLILMTPVISDKWEWRECDFHPEHLHLFSEEHIRSWLKPIHMELWYPGHCLIVCEA